jgi:hypothetical protein
MYMLFAWGLISVNYPVLLVWNFVRYGTESLGRQVLSEVGFASRWVVASGGLTVHNDRTNVVRAGA